MGLIANKFSLLTVLVLCLGFFPFPKSFASEQEILSKAISRFSGEIISIKNNTTIDIDRYGLQGKISVRYDENCSAASGCSSISLSVRRNRQNTSASDWKAVPLEDFKFPWGKSFWYGLDGAKKAFLDYPHFGEDYYQAVVVVHEKQKGHSLIAVYVASREIGELAVEPAPVDFVKFEMEPASNMKSEKSQPLYKFVPVAMMRSKAG
jgi:hypothetical protein